MFYNKRALIKFTAKALIIVLGAQLALPAVSFALTSGPTQPEVQSFEPVGTTNMVDLFTGDFVYNIPLLDIEGYPVNIAYHSGSGSEDEASWVGFGWNINPGSVNRSVRGLPDDFDGDKIQKTLNLADEKNIRVGLGAGAELAGVGTPILDLTADINGSINVSNYRGVSVDIDFALGAGVNVMPPSSGVGLNAGVGINLGVGSQSGADIGASYTLGLSFKSSQIAADDISGGFGLTKGTGYSTRSGVKARSFSISSNARMGGREVDGPALSTSVPIGLQNIVPVITNATTMDMYRGQIKLGGEVFGIYPNLAVFGMISNVSYEKQSSRKSYGYLYAQDGDESSIMDFTRDKDGTFNKSMRYLPPGNMTYDVYSVTGQGTGGSFRPYRNDFGSVFDPAVSSKANDFSLNAEFGTGNLVEAGVDGTVSHTTSTSGPWPQYKRPFSHSQDGSIYENVYFKQAGEATLTDDDFLNAIHGITPITGAQAQSLPERKPGTASQRVPRGDLVYYFTGNEAAKTGVASSTDIVSYNSADGFAGGPDVSKTTYSRVAAPRSGSQISEIVQVKQDGRKYIYGLPAMNTSQTAATFSVSPSGTANGLMTYTDAEASVGNPHGPSHFYSATQTPAYAHSYLLTDVESADYVDVTGNGPSDDDLGSYTKFNYTLKGAGYHWKAPYGDHTAQYDPGFKSDPTDDKASFLSGTREQWYLHSIETRNYVAEFYTSERADAKGENSGDYSYKLDSIKLYNKHDRFINKGAAVPIKTVMFAYDYSLWKNTPNSDSGGKLTLKKIYIRYGNSDKNMLSPYQFSYKDKDQSGASYSYGAASKDRWGAYKPNTGMMSNIDFPFVDQNDPNENDHVAACVLDTITLPSGGTINVQYESDDYAYVQDRPAMEMFMLAGVGNSKAFSPGDQLYTDEKSPNLYFYFKRRKNDERPGLSFKDTYLKGQDLLFFNMETRLVDNRYEPVKGFAKVTDIGICQGNDDYGYVQVKSVAPIGGGAHLNPATYTAINFARYYLPQVIFPGNNPYESNIKNVLSGLKYAFGELISFAKNPVRRMVEEGKAKSVHLGRSFIRLTNPGRDKKGGGLRVKQLAFYDNWSALAGGNASTAEYGKNYDYTTEATDGAGKISSGVASYEPLIGGDENPFRLPEEYRVQSASNWPPNDPVGVYQELPIGESLYPSAVVGYSRVTVTSIHQAEGRSSQSEDIHDFYTARDFPIQAYSTPIAVLDDHHHYGFVNQSQVFKATQGYTLVFNDMHGKPKREEHRVILPGTGQSQLISYKQYNYNLDGNKLSSQVPVISYDVQAGKLRKTTGTVGYEEDITIDSRERTDKTKSKTIYGNFNLFMAGIIPVPIPLIYPYGFNFTNQFDAVVATKVVQQYGLLKSIQSYQDGALTTVTNEAYDPVTGQPLITSVNNEFRDREYSVSYPAWWGYQSMGPSYVNTGYTEHFDQVKIDGNDVGELPTGATVRNYRLGDELLLTTGTGKTFNVWVTGFKAPDSTFSCNADFNESYRYLDTVDVPFSLNDYPHVLVKPRFKYNTGWPANGTLTGVHIKVVRSGDKNQLNENVLSYTGMSIPFDGNGYLKDDLDSLISLSGRTYSDTLTAILPKYDPNINPTTYDSLNEYVNGTRGIKRLFREYGYITPRDYSQVNTRKSGLFSAVSLWKNGPPLYPDLDNKTYCLEFVDCPDSILGMYKCVNVLRYDGSIPDVASLTNSYLRAEPSADPNWVVARTVTKYSPWGFELENQDAIGNYTTAEYDYNNQLPVALAKNARQHEIFAENFESYRLLQVLDNYLVFFTSPFRTYFPATDVTTAAPYVLPAALGTSGFSIVKGTAHTGYYSLLTPTGSAHFSVNVAGSPVQPGQPRFIPVTLETGKIYVYSYWFRPKSPGANVTSYSHPSGVQPKSNIIDGWQQEEGTITVASGTTKSITLPANCYVDDIRIYPVNANMKSFVYDPVNQRLMATLDENNFATIYEYDQEGNLIRTKKETEEGVMTVMESRSANAKTVK